SRSDQGDGHPRKTSYFIRAINDFIFIRQNTGQRLSCSVFFFRNTFNQNEKYEISNTSLGSFTTRILRWINRKK
ncbi:MAG: hypothetical protein KDC69_11235, partial [Flavobacteriaceae bacterium]|nr:hypothetical protein [Flavobacteriaceae bacterium]